MSVEEQWVAWIRRAEAEGVRIDLDAYNARVRASERAQPPAEAMALPEPWTDGFRTVSQEDLLDLMSGR